MLQHEGRPNTPKGGEKPHDYTNPSPLTNNLSKPALQDTVGRLTHHQPNIKQADTIRKWDTEVHAI